MFKFCKVNEYQNVFRVVVEIAASESQSHMSQSRKRARADISSPMLAGSYRSSMNAMWCGLLNGAWWYWAGGLYGGRIWAVEDRAEIELRLDAARPTPVETIMSEFPLDFWCKVGLRERKGVVAHLDLGTTCESWSVRGDLARWWLRSKDAFTDAVHVCLAADAADSISGRRISLNEYLRWCRTWATGVSDSDLHGDGRACVAKLVRNHRRLQRVEVVWGPLVRSFLLSKCAPSGDAQGAAGRTLQHPLLATPSHDWAGGSGWEDEGARARIVPAPRCAVVDQVLDEDEPRVAIDRSKTQCTLCRKALLFDTHDGVQRFGIRSLHGLLSSREGLAVMRTREGICVHARRLTSSPEMLTLFLVKGCLCSCYKNSPERFHEWKTAVQRKIGNLLVHWPHVSSHAKTVVERNLQSSRAYLDVVSDALHDRICAGDLSRDDARMACDLMCYMFAICEESRRCMQSSVGARVFPVPVDLADPMLVLSAASSAHAERRIALLAAAWIDMEEEGVGTAPGLLRQQQQHAHQQQQRSERVLQPIVPVFDADDGDSVRGTIVAVLDRALQPACPICGTHIWLEDGCTAVLCAACGHRSCFMCAKPELVNLDGSCTWARIEALIPPTACFEEVARTFALNEHLTAWRLNREVTNGADTSFSRRCSRAGLSRVAPHAAPETALGGLRLTSHSDTRCAVFVEGEVSRDTHICHSRYAALHVLVGSGNEADGRKLVGRCVRMLAECVAFSTINGRLPGMADRVFAQLLEQHELERRARPAVAELLARLHACADEREAFVWSLNCPNPHRHPSCELGAGETCRLAAVKDTVLANAIQE